MDKLTEANAVVEPKRRVRSDTVTTASLTLDHLLSPILEPTRTNAGHRGVPLHSAAFDEMAEFHRRSARVFGLHISVLPDAEYASYVDLRTRTVTLAQSNVGS